MASAESFRERWLHRALTLPAYALAWPLSTALLPVALVLVGAFDLATDRRFPRSRALLFGWVYLACECGGLLASVALWVGSCAASAERAASWHYALQGVWARAMLGASARQLNPAAPEGWPSVPQQRCSRRVLR